mmetsp:Transcript_23228/g.39714  ORF Transcript_23228/g.39714 Transcript_23228/m.39714 type:complete len:384 (-) Transcript_23228:363-1514(-)|eukprot:CAMPEP_0183704440 /NCGR_PEP_ID=MMETSP0737-20130205/1759_1 /TAXON_ID=385413 /ORGANISM="Thalassiosira miniscula, Strain CCMP1093" /LENGTH=383 /DNA_ID=CAMNT_0025931299 /DNA_START=326 /DNA_END=1477 /DNA_ORIENTATION=-
MTSSDRTINRLIILVATVVFFFVNERHNRKLSAKLLEMGVQQDRNADDFRSEYVGYAENYTAGLAETYIMTHLDELGYGSTTNNPVTCNIWQTPDATTKEVYANLYQYMQDIKKHQEAVENFTTLPNLMTEIIHTGKHDVCATTRLHPEGLRGLFPSGQLSITPNGYVEPMLPPMRHPRICHPENNAALKYWMFDLNYLVHDWERMCRRLKPHSKLVLIDMGASFDFQGTKSPMIALFELYEKMGFVFDHIYGFEITPKDATTIYNRLPQKYIPAYHWINAGVTRERGHNLNPLHSIVKSFTEDDLIVVKMDIDTSSIEVPLMRELIEDDVLVKLVDQFYFEHHVHMGDLARSWLRTMDGTLKESLEMFGKLRERGVAAHSWV